MMSVDLTGYLEDLVSLLMQMAFEARENNLDDSFQTGRLFAFYEVLTLMQSQARAFGIEESAFNLDINLDALLQESSEASPLTDIKSDEPSTSQEN
jgi:hypothetical protein